MSSAVDSAPERFLDALNRLNQVHQQLELTNQLQKTSNRPVGVKFEEDAIREMIESIESDLDAADLVSRHIMTVLHKVLHATPIEWAIRGRITQLLNTLYVRLKRTDNSAHVHAATSDQAKELADARNRLTFLCDALKKTHTSPIDALQALIVPFTVLNRSHLECDRPLIATAQKLIMRIQQGHAPSSSTTNSDTTESQETKPSATSKKRAVDLSLVKPDPDDPLLDTATLPTPTEESSKMAQTRRKISDLNKDISKNEHLVQIQLPPIIDQEPNMVVDPVIKTKPGVDSTNPLTMLEHRQESLKEYRRQWKQNEQQRLQEATASMVPSNEQYEHVRMAVLDIPTSHPYNYDAAFYGILLNELEPFSNMLVSYTTDREKLLLKQPVMRRAMIEKYMRGWNPRNGDERQCTLRERCAFSSLCRLISHSQNPTGEIPGVAFPLPSLQEGEPPIQNLCIFCILQTVQYMVVQTKQRHLPPNSTINPFSVISNKPGEYCHEDLHASHDDCLENYAFFNGILGFFPVYSNSHFVEKFQDGKPMEGVWIQHTVPYFSSGAGSADTSRYAHTTSEC